METLVNQATRSYLSLVIFQVQQEGRLALLHKSPLTPKGLLLSTLRCAVACTHLLQCANFPLGTHQVCREQNRSANLQNSQKSR